MKKCSKCGTVKPLDEFGVQTRNRDGRHSHCRLCLRAQRLADYHKHKARKNPERNARRRGTGSHWASALKTKYGITVDQYDTILQKQDYCCAICRQPETQRDTRYGQVLRLAVDHDHKTGRIRGLLCSACNTAIGKFNDDPDLIQSAIAYLKQQKPPAEAGG